MGLALLQRPLFLPKSCTGRPRVGLVRNTQWHYPSYRDVETVPTHPRPRPDPGKTNDVLRLRRLSGCAARSLSSFYLPLSQCRYFCRYFGTVPTSILKFGTVRDSTWKGTWYGLYCWYSTWYTRCIGWLGAVTDIMWQLLTIYYRDRWYNVSI